MKKLDPVPEVKSKPQKLKLDPGVESAKANKAFTEMQGAAQKAFTAISGVTSAIFANALSKIKSQFQQSQNALNSWQEKAMQGAEGNSKKQAAIQRIYHAEQIKLAHEKAIKEAEVARKQAEMNKAQKLIEVIIQTGVNITKYTGDLPLMAPLLAVAIAEGAAQAASIAAQPLPPIPKFATGVVGFKGKGTETSDSNPVLISHN